MDSIATNVDFILFKIAAIGDTTSNGIELSSTIESDYENNFFYTGCTGIINFYYFNSIKKSITNKKPCSINETVEHSTQDDFVRLLFNLKLVLSSAGVLG